MSRVLADSNAFCNSWKLVPLRPPGTTISPSSHPGFSFKLASPLARWGSFEVQSCPLRVIRRISLESIRASSRYPSNLTSKSQSSGVPGSASTSVARTGRNVRGAARFTAPAGIRVLVATEKCSADKGRARDVIVNSLRIKVKQVLRDLRHHGRPAGIRHRVAEQAQHPRCRHNHEPVECVILARS